MENFMSKTKDALSKAVESAEKYSKLAVDKTSSAIDKAKVSIAVNDAEKKIKDIFIDGKIPVSERSIWPIVEDCEGSIIWVPGLKKSAFEAESDQGSFIILKYV